jgi:SAM-dependent methyltransferase
LNATMPSLFDFPAIYELVMPRPPQELAREVTNLELLLQGRGVTHGRILELACGACAHGLPLAQRGHHVAGLDRSAGMLALAGQRAAEAGVAVELRQGDVVDFQLDLPPFDCAIFLYETFQLLTEYDDLLRHFAAVRRHLVPGALYVIDFSPAKHGVGTTQSEWGRRTIPLANGQIETWNEDYPGDWVAGTSHLIVHCRVEQNGETFTTLDDWRIRQYSPWELAVLVRSLPGWQLDGFCSWRDLGPEFADDSHYWMVLRTMATP